MSQTDFYKVLGVSAGASEGDIRRAYKRRSLETHPDRFPVGSEAQRAATGQFQEVNNAYYVLSDGGRRREYDASTSRGGGGGDGFGAWWNRARPSETQQERTADSQFESVFEEMMADEAGAGAAAAQGKGRFYGLLGGGAGAVLGFIVANVPGALAGAVAGNRLGAIRDTKGKPVYQVFQEMPHAEKARMLSELLSKVMAQLS
ncbi:DNAJ domain-containing protein [Taphrina deformans PYCC 5710]|uniref:DNAJ domain-containing protein n=1 Tax=Taphrina deformans (strain PYCC 5710 / ATCC 11124 / CBS 356.35 / IMI 108563 / JCM 9778 / NBRC 8474) TaxID=1097556 RepID=R4XCL1_TAPDE|nr:DNAJ domain-containing protein [Taphrina deformans PYCC 5710]|eukprot:CCG82106.1 DNAJ domain-containing protein [Taphrina deformans PYCC 5710]